MTRTSAFRLLIAALLVLAQIGSAAHALSHFGSHVPNSIGEGIAGDNPPVPDAGGRHPEACGLCAAYPTAFAGGVSPAIAPVSAAVTIPSLVPAARADWRHTPGSIRAPPTSSARFPG